MIIEAISLTVAGLVLQKQANRKNEQALRAWHELNDVQIFLTKNHIDINTYRLKYSDHRAKMLRLTNYTGIDEVQIKELASILNNELRSFNSEMN